MLNQGENKGIISSEIGHRLMKIHGCFKKVNELLITNSFIFEDTRKETIIEIINSAKHSKGNQTLVMKEIFPFASRKIVQESLRELIPVYLDAANWEKQEINTKRDIRYRNTCPLYEIVGTMTSETCIDEVLEEPSILI